MYAVGRLGSYISGGLYSVSGPFHVFGGAVDIVVVEQQDGSFKSSPWYVRFGKFQGVLKGKEKVVNISVNGIDANFQMYLDERGQAYFLKEVEGEEEDSPLLYPSSCDEMDGGSQNNTREMRSKSCNYYANESNLGDQIDANIGKAVARTNSRQTRILGLVFGRQSMRKKHYQEGDDDGAVGRISSWDRAEIAANLLEVQWSTNLAISKRRKDAAVLFSVSDTSNVKRVEDMPNIDEQGQHRSSEPGIIEASSDHPMLSEPTGSCDVKVGTAFQSGCEGLEYSVEESYIEMQSLSTREKVVEPSITCESVLEQKCEMISVLPRNIDEPTLWSAMHNDNAEGIISVVVTPDPQIPPMPEACSSGRSDEEQASEQRDVSLTSFDRCKEESGSDRDQAFMHCETTETSTGGMEGTNKENHETLHLPDRGPAKTHLGVETLHATAKLLPEDTSYQKAETIEAEMEHIRSCHDCCQAKNPCPRISGLDELNIEKLPTESKPYAQMVTVTPIFVSVEAVAMAQNVCTIESFSKPDHCSQSEKCESVGDSVQFYGDRGLRKAFSTQEFESLQDEHFLFSDLDEYKLRESLSELNLSVGRDNENHSSFCLEGIGDGSNPVNNEACSSTDQSVQEDQLDNIGNLIGDLDALSKPIGIPKVHGVARAKVERPVKSLPIMWSCTECLDRDNFHHPLSHSVDSHFKSQDWNSDGRGKRHTISVDADNEDQSSQERSDEQDTHVSEGHRNGAGTPGEPPKEVVSSDGNWRLWPFSRKKSRSRKTMQPLLHDSEISNSESVSDINIKEERDSNVPKSKGRKEMVKAKTPTSEQLALLNLKEGSNTVTFTFSTAMLGKQKVDARIYLWKWNTRIVISDVDGTITKSDVLGQFMPLVGVDWSQTGVAHLFSAIKENGYQLLFLSARAISQAYLTRQFLINLKQDGKALPDGPVVISPDGLFPSLFREVIRRTPHEFKIACLEDIRALFPHDCNPFYAGFGNRDTDEISYLKVGIPRGKIFIINPKGEVAVNRRVDTKSYTSLRALVDDMFPPAASSEQEDFNTWNYWKLPPPVIDN